MSPASFLRWTRFLPVLALASCWHGAVAQELMIHPKRIVLEGNQRAGQLEIINNSKKSATYYLELVNRRMGENGEFSPVDTPAPGEQFADAMLRYSPRRVTLAPGTSQVVRIMARRPADLATGEYRSHLLFVKQPDATQDRAAESSNEAGDGIGVVLSVLMGVSIPVIVRQGETSASVSLENPSLLRATSGQGPAVAFDLRRTGNRSVYGDLTATFVPTRGPAQEIGRAGGVAVYVPNTNRRMKLQLDPPAGLELAHGTLTLRFQQEAAQGGAVLAQADLPIP